MGPVGIWIEIIKVYAVFWDGVEVNAEEIAPSFAELDRPGSTVYADADRRFGEGLWVLMCGHSARSAICRVGENGLGLQEWEDKSDILAETHVLMNDWRLPSVKMG